jgi:hypothetical protein
MPGEAPPVRVVPDRRPVTPLSVPAAPVAEAPAQAASAPATDAVIAGLAMEWLTLDARAKVGELFARTTAAGEAAEATDVAGFLTAQEHEALGTTRGKALTLRALATGAGRHVHKTGTALRQQHVQVGAA